MIQRPTIPHFKPQIVDNKFLGGQGRDSLKRLPYPFFRKSTLFTKVAKILSSTMWAIVNFSYTYI